MSKPLRNVIALIAGFALGSGANMLLIMLGPALVAPPAGVDMSNAQSLGAAMHLFEPGHFVMPFLAHAVGTFVGALATYLIAASHKARMAWAIGVVFLCGGIAAIFMIPAPPWFMVLDLLAAYLPMAWIAIQLGRRITGSDAGTASPQG